MLFDVHVVMHILLATQQVKTPLKGGSIHMKYDRTGKR
jgi:hypothetical protein